MKESYACRCILSDPRSRRGRWYTLTAVLLVCACATVSGAKTIDEVAEWGQGVGFELLEAIGVRRHLLSAVPQGTVVTPRPG